MTPPANSLHPEHALEQAYIERAHLAVQRDRSQAKRAAESAGDKFAARSIRSQKLARLREPVDPDALCFARIDLENGRTYYLGREAVHDDHSKLLVINWQRPVVAPFYTAHRQDPQGLELRRRFQLDQLRLLGIVDDVFGPAAATEASIKAVSAPAVSDEAVLRSPEVPPESDAEPEVVAAPIEPHVVDAILADMDRARGTEMRDIVATIEARQYELISDSIDGILAIQGGPGTGKTAIALHRAAWLLYNHRDDLERTGVLIVGPNRTFMEYVAQVLPSLGESAVVQLAIDRVADLGDVRVRGRENANVARMKGDARMAQIVQHAVTARVRVPAEDVALTIEHTPLTLGQDRIAALVEDAWRSAQTYLSARETFRRTLVALAQEQMAESSRLLRGRATPAAIEMAVIGSGGPLDRIWPTATAPEVIRDLLNSRQRLAAAGPSLTEDERELLQRERQRLLREEPWTSADIPLLDEADAALRGVSVSYGYVLADEAQDLSPMQLRMVFRRSAMGRATLVGDIAQATGPTRFADWDDLVRAAAVDAEPRIAELAIGYRVPRQIIELAAQLLPRIAPEILIPNAVREGPEEPRLLAIDETDLGPALVRDVMRRVEGDRTVGIVARPGDHERLRALLGESGIRAGDVLADGLARQVTVLSPAQAKGLEFDHVVVVEPAAIAGPDEQWAYVYIALTRATRTLSVLYSTREPFEVPAPEVETPPVIVAAATEVGPPPAIVAPVADAQVGTFLGPRYTEALMQAKFIHSGQHRRGTFVPYLAHLQAVASLVLEDGGSENEAIAALLHDAVEDNGPQTLDRIVDQFGLTVARIVASCTEPDEDTGRSWRDRKIAHMGVVETGGPEVRRVVLAEKLDNARGLLRDYRQLGPRLWIRMDVDPEDVLWYFLALSDLFVTERPGDMASELRDTVERLLDLVSQPGA
jgi:DNA helicase IV